MPVTWAKASVMAASRLSTVRALAERSCCLIFDHACSMGVEVGRIRRQVKQFRSRGLAQAPYSFHFMGGQIVHNHHLPRLQARTQHLLDVG